MARFRGTVEGNRSQASRLGHKKSGLRVEAQSWEGKVCVSLWYSEERDCDMARVTLARHHGKGAPVTTLYIGPVSGAGFVEGVTS